MGPLAQPHFPGPVCSVGKKSACSAGDPGSIPELAWRREWQPTPVFLPGEFHGQRSLAVYSPWGHKELDTTKQLQFTSHLQLRNYWKSNSLTFSSPPPFLLVYFQTSSFLLLLLICVLIYLCLFSFPKLSPSMSLTAESFSDILYDCWWQVRLTREDV